MAVDLESLADNFLKNQCTPQEARLVLDWFETRSGRKYLQEQLKKDAQLLENDNLFISPVNVPSAKMFGGILGNLDEENITTDPERSIKPDSRTVPWKALGAKRWFLVAASVIGISFFALTAYNHLSNRKVSHSTNYGEIARFILPDSSFVTLNGNSRIEYDAMWDADQAREVKLDGEAFFSVKHKFNDQKFIVVIADTTQIEVLGTEFNVSDRKNQTQVVLVSGSIRLMMQTDRKATSTILKPGESVEITPASATLKRRLADPEIITSWTSNKLTFDNTSVREICERLKETYGYRIEFSDQKIMNQRISGSVPNQSIDMVLEGLQAILGVKFKKTRD